ncbi:hypothetical protein Anas_01638 [Armadillidium nasatum]|uniref:Uncharacterized protein n=1 Tax=Armadillidium nasatum TaxID=96803 RepID=A0A5N5TFS1_9CRUS|nr:hypothetical protein Anas_01638 [Armadillidium nasatum]
MKVTMVSSFVPSRSIKNIREIVIKNVTTDHLLSTTFDVPSDAITKLFHETPKLCSDGLQQSHVQNLKNEEFDIILISIFFDLCYLSFVHHFKVPFIFMTSSALVGSMSDYLNNIHFPSISGSILVEPNFPFTFTERLTAVSAETTFTLLLKHYLEPRMYSICVERGLCPKDMPTFSKIIQNASLAIINSVRTLEWPPRPLMPNIIYAGGIHIKPPKELQVDLEEFIQGAGEDGFIYFSLGSALKPSFLPEVHRKMLINVFGSLKQRVLWKWDQQTMADLPENVKLSKWLPQADILVSMCIETLHKYFDKKSIYLIYIEISTQRKYIDSVLICSLNIDISALMKGISEYRSLLMKDRLVEPEEEVAYWVEYVMRHKGAPHIMSPISMMTWYEIYNIDVWALVVTVLVGVFCFILVVGRCFWRLCRRNQIHKRKKE